MIAINVVISIFAGGGLYLIAGAITQSTVFLGVTKRRLEDETLSGGAAQQPKPSYIENLLYQARAEHITPSEFIATSLGIGVIMGMGFLYATRSIIVAIVALASGGVAYYLYLTNRRNKAMLEYEEEQPQVAYLLYNAFRSMGFNLNGVIAMVINNGPDIVRDDWTRILAALSGAVPDHRLINQVLTKRNSPGLSKLVEAILLFQSNMEKLPEVLLDLRQDITAEVRLTREANRELSGPKRELALVCIMPLALQIVFILLAPSIRDFYSSVLGQFITIGLYAYSAILYIVGTNKATKMIQLKKPDSLVVEHRKESAYKQPGSSIQGAMAELEEREVILEELSEQEDPRRPGSLEDNDNALKLDDF